MIFNDIFKKIKSAFQPVPMAGYNNNSRSNTGAKYPGGMSTKNRIISYDHYALRQAARDSMQDSTVCRALVDRFADTVADSGLKLKPVPIPEMIGVSPESAEIWAEETAQKFHMWAKSKNSDRSCVNNFYQNQHLYQIFQHRDNDIFVNFSYSREKNLVNPLQIKFIDPNQINGASYTTTYAQYFSDDGIIRDAAGKEIAYRIWELNNQTKKYESKTIPAVGEKSGRTMMIHGFNPEYAGQTRGFSRIAHALQEFEQITDLSQATIQKAINQACFVFAVENDQTDASNPLEGRVAGPVRQYGAYSEPVETSQNVGETEPIINWESMPEATFSNPGSAAITNLRQGDKLKFLQDTSPSAQYNSFVDSFVSYLSASTGMPVELLLMKFNSNYSASRAALILFWRVANMWREEMAADFLNPVYESWLSEEIAAGRIKCPGWSDTRIRQAWLNCEWSGSPMPSIDPLKSMQASKLSVELAAETLDDVAREFNGSSGKANRVKLARQFNELPEPSWGWMPGKQQEQQQSEEE